MAIADFGFRIADFTLKKAAGKNKRVFFNHRFSLISALDPAPCPAPCSLLLNHLVRPRQHIRRNCETELLGCL